MKKWLKVGLILLILAGLSIGLYFILQACGVTDIETFPPDTLKAVINV